MEKSSGAERWPVALPLPVSGSMAGAETVGQKIIRALCLKCGYGYGYSYASAYVSREQIRSLLFHDVFNEGDQGVVLFRTNQAIATTIDTSRVY